MIVKNEAALLERCLSCVKPFADEIIIVDTGSTDETKQIAAKFTNRIYDYKWINNFADARNTSFSYATCDYIYMADADEVIKPEEIQKIIRLKYVLDPSIDIVQMYYDNQLQFNTTYNYDCELRPKLFKRVLKFVFHDPVHEVVSLSPVIWDSDIKITHKPTGNHSTRDFITFEKAIKQYGKLSPRLNSMYARELFISGSDDDFKIALKYFDDNYENQTDMTVIRQFQCVIAKAAFIVNDTELFFKAVLKNLATGKGSSEVCFMLGEHYEKLNDFKEAAMWYYNSAFECKPELNIKYQGEFPYKKLIRLNEILGNQSEVQKYKGLLAQAQAQTPTKNSDS
jgi:glycosyltransferase involved in cell wall biosynthesis